MTSARPVSTNDDMRDELFRLEQLVEADSYGRAGWVEELGRTATHLQLSTADLRSVAAQLTWLARRLGQPIPTLSAHCSDTGVVGLIHQYVCGQRLRFDFNFRGLLRFSQSHETSPHAADALIQSFRVFAELGSRQPGAAADLELVLRLPDLDNRARHVCLAGLWSAHTVPGQGQLLLDLADQMISLGEGDGTVYFRRAQANRLLGNYQAALDDIDCALSTTQPGNNEVNQDYLRERQLIGLAVQFSASSS